MTVEERMSAMEKAYGTQSELMRELRDAVTVTAALEARQGKVLREHSEWLASHDEAMKRHDLAMREHDAAMTELDTRIARLVSGFGAFIVAGKEGV
jgi:uncharacterized coiled-coil protein SlyX